MENWRPDWKNPISYPDPKTTTPKEWAWEFLRRNQNYQKVFKELAGSPSDETLWNELDIYGEGLVLNKYWTCSEPFLEGETLGEVIRRTLPKNVFYTITNRSIQEQFKFEWLFPGLPDPSKKLPVVGFFFKLTGPAFHAGKKNGDGSESIQITKKENEAVLTFDLAFPIDRQIRIAQRHLTIQREKYLKQHKKKERAKPREVKEMYPHYLRVLDGESSGASNAEMAKVLLPNDLDNYPDYPARKKINNWLKAAKRIRDGNYITIASL